jgi:pimeloyl-ACP methyl ester carboxylesterase
MSGARVVEEARFLDTDAGDSLFAVLTRPEAPARGAGIVILAGGRYGSTAGRNQVGARLAAAFAQRGFHSIRLDYHGVGDSTGVIREFVLHEPFVGDLRAGVDVLRREGVDTIGVLGDCFGSRTALATAATSGDIAALFLVSLPWRDLARSNRKATLVSSELSMVDYMRRGARTRTFKNFFDPTKRRDYVRLIIAKARSEARRFTAKVRGSDLEPWVSTRVVRQLEAVRASAAPTLLLYGSGPAEDYSNDFLALRRMRSLAWVGDPSGPIDVRVLDQPIAGYRNVVSQDQVVELAREWFDAAIPI